RLNEHPHLQPTLSTQQSSGLPKERTKSQITHTCPITFTLEVEGIEQQHQLRCTRVYNRVRNAARFPRNRSALTISSVPRSEIAAPSSGGVASSVFSCHIGIGYDNVSIECAV